MAEKESQPSWAAWIEMSNIAGQVSKPFCRSPLGLRGLKLNTITNTTKGERLSQPSWAAWIEIYFVASAYKHHKSQPSWAAWIEITSSSITSLSPGSQPSWAAWIEI